MKNKKGFTLIELLVVVLIIGILAAIAVPQYQKVVAKSHYTFIQNITKAIYDAQQAYYLANNKYTNNFNELDINMPTICGIKQCFFDWGFCSMYPEDPQIICSYGTYDTDRIALTFNLKTGKRRCIASSATGSNTNVYDIVCKQETGKNSDNEGSSRYYSY